MVLLDKLTPQGELVGFTGGGPFHIENLLLGTEVLFRFPVTFKTPSHRQGGGLGDKRHQVNPTVAACAANPFVEVDGVIEVSIFRKIVNAIPLNRLVVAKTVAHRSEDRAVAPDLRVTRHARFGRRDAGERRRFHSDVAVTAIDAQRVGMVLVTKLHGLVDRHPDARHVRRPEKRVIHRAEARGEESTDQDRNTRQRVHARLKNLRHRLPFPSLFSRENFESTAGGKRLPLIFHER